MFIVIFDDGEEANKAAQLDWVYATSLPDSLYDKVTDAIEGVTD